MDTFVASSDLAVLDDAVVCTSGFSWFGGLEVSFFFRAPEPADRNDLAADRWEHCMESVPEGHWNVIAEVGLDRAEGAIGVR